VNTSRLVGAAALALLLFVNLVVSAPARLLNLFVPGELVVLRGLSGTVWDGTASGVLIRLPQGYFQLGTLEWSLHPLSLLTLAPHLTLNTEWGRQTLAAEVIVQNSQDIDVLNLEAQVAANLLGRFAPVAVGGLFSLQAELLQVRDGMPFGGEGRLVWQDAGWNSPRGLVPLGTFALDFQQPEGDALQGQIVTLSGPMQATGSLQLHQRHYEVDVLLSSEVALDAQVQQMLSLIAQPEGVGFRLKLAGDL
jgi:general secretion pathway protein N